MLTFKGKEVVVEGTETTGGEEECLLLAETLLVARRIIEHGEDDEEGGDNVMVEVDELRLILAGIEAKLLLVIAGLNLVSGRVGLRLDNQMRTVQSSEALASIFG